MIRLCITCYDIIQSRKHGSRISVHPAVQIATRYKAGVLGKTAYPAVCLIRLFTQTIFKNTIVHEVQIV